MLQALNPCSMKVQSDVNCDWWEFKLTLVWDEMSQTTRQFASVPHVLAIYPYIILVNSNGKLILLRICRRKTSPLYPYPISLIEAIIYTETTFLHWNKPNPWLNPKILFNIHVEEYFRMKIINAHRTSPLTILYSAASPKSFPWKNITQIVILGLEQLIWETALKVLWSLERLSRVKKIGFHSHRWSSARW